MNLKIKRILGESRLAKEKEREQETKEAEKREKKDRVILVANDKRKL